MSFLEVYGSKKVAPAKFKSPRISLLEGLFQAEKPRFFVVLNLLSTLPFHSKAMITVPWTVPVFLKCKVSLRKPSDIDFFAL